MCVARACARICDTAGNDGHQLMKLSRIASVTDVDRAREIGLLEEGADFRLYSEPGARRMYVYNIDRLRTAWRSHSWKIAKSWQMGVEPLKKWLASVS